MTPSLPTKFNVHATYQRTDSKGHKSPVIDITDGVDTIETDASWKELHTYIPSKVIAENTKWLGSFNRRLRAKCNCKRHWTTYLKSYPPDWNNWFAWTVEAHNNVNRRLNSSSGGNKPILSIEEARQIWLPLPSPQASGETPATA